MTDLEPPETVMLSVAIDDFFAAKKAEHLSQNTIRDYTVTLRRLYAFVGDIPIADITVSQVRNFLGGLEVSKKTVLNAYTALSSLWTWAVRDGLVMNHIIRKVTPPKPEKREIRPLARNEIAELMKHLGEPALRNRVMILFLLDTGVRASELGSLKIGDIQGEYVRVFGKGDKERSIPISATTMRALLDYLATRKRATTKSPLFPVKSGNPMSRQTLRKWLERVGNRSGVTNVHPHRFRHTFAINYLRNGGDAISLQQLLGHSTLDMVKEYVDLAKEDLATIHRRASPVENWGMKEM